MQAWKTRRYFDQRTAAKSWHEMNGLRGHGSGPRWQPGAGGMCLHTIVQDPSNPSRMFVAISAAGAFRTDDAGATWRPINQGLHSQYLPDPKADVGHCVHRIAMHRSAPGTLFMQKHWDVMRSDDAGDSWREISGNLPTDFSAANRWRAAPIRSLPSGFCRHAVFRREDSAHRRS